MADDERGGGGSGDGGGGGGEGPSGDGREQDHLLPIANIGRIMKQGVPRSAKISKDAKECVQECVSEFISFITSEANDKCVQEKRKTINGDDLIWAMKSLGFDSYVEPLTIYLNRYKEVMSTELSADVRSGRRKADGSVEQESEFGDASAKPLGGVAFPGMGVQGMPLYGAQLQLPRGGMVMPMSGYMQPQVDGLAMGGYAQLQVDGLAMPGYAQSQIDGLAMAGYAQPLADGSMAYPQQLADGAMGYAQQLADGATAYPQQLADGATAYPQQLADGATAYPQQLAHGSVGYPQPQADSGVMAATINNGTPQCAQQPEVGGGSHIS
jgi:nuclear transcription Y subunit beta